MTLGSHGRTGGASLSRSAYRPDRAASSCRPRPTPVNKLPQTCPQQCENAAALWIGDATVQAWTIPCHKTVERTGRPEGSGRSGELPRRAVLPTAPPRPARSLASSRAVGRCHYCGHVPGLISVMAGLASSRCRRERTSAKLGWQRDYSFDGCSISQRGTFRTFAALCRTNGGSYNRYQAKSETEIGA